MTSRCLRAVSAVAVLVAGGLLVASGTFAAERAGAAAATGTEPDVTIVTPALERVTGPASGPRPAPWAALVAATAIVLVAGASGGLRPGAVVPVGRLLPSPHRGRAPPPPPR